MNFIVFVVVTQQYHNIMQNDGLSLYGIINSNRTLHIWVSKFYFAINTSQRKLCKAWKITNLLNLNINLSKKKQKKNNNNKQINKQTG